MRNTMARSIDYYFSVISPWAYIGHVPFMDIARRHGARVTYKPVALAEVFAETGGLPLAKRAPARQRYRWMELQRWRAKRGLEFNLKPKHWPCDPGLADRFVIAAAAAGKDPDKFLRAAFAGIWEKEQNLADEATITALGRDAGLDAAALLAAAKQDAATATYQKNRDEAISAGAFGSPAYVIDGEVFWGQDRLDFVDDMLKSERKAFAALG
jgi:2-hydroxychromene-2-carboxylate isomerase